MTAKPNNTLFRVDAVHSERTESEVLDHREVRSCFVRRQYFGFEEEPIGGSFHGKQILLQEPHRHSIVRFTGVPSGYSHSLSSRDGIARLYAVPDRRLPKRTWIELL